MNQEATMTASEHADTIRDALGRPAFGCDLEAVQAARAALAALEAELAEARRERDEIETTLMEVDSGGMLLRAEAAEAENARLKAALRESLDLIVIDSDGTTVPIDPDTWGPVWERGNDLLASGSEGDTA